MMSPPINAPKPHQKVELVTLNKFAKFHHYTPNNKNVMMGFDEPKKPGLDRVKRIKHLLWALFSCVLKTYSLQKCMIRLAIPFLTACCF